jgi:hypothetical protein
VVLEQDATAEMAKEIQSPEIISLVQRVLAATAFSINRENFGRHDFGNPISVSQTSMM